MNNVTPLPAVHGADRRPVDLTRRTLPPLPAAAAKKLEESLIGYAESNEIVGGFYDQEYRVKLLDLGLPREAAQLRLVMGWARTIVDVLAERIEPVAFAHESIDDDESSELWELSGAASAIPQAVTDMLVYGIGFISATAGNPAVGEPRVLVRAHSATNTTATIDGRTGRVTEALTLHSDTRATLWLPSTVSELSRSASGAAWELDSVAHNPLGVVPMVAMPNAARAGRPGGRSEITPAIRTAIGSATRAIISMDVNREFFSIPHRYILGMAGEFRGQDGAVLESWKLAARAMLKIPYGEDGEDIQVGEFSTVAPGPFLDQIRGLANIAASEAAIPGMYLGVESASNPSSADAIRMAESRLVRRSRHRISAMRPHLARLGQIALAIHRGTSIAETPMPRCEFSDPATSAFSADADAWVKLMVAGAAPKHSEVIWRRMGFSEPEIRALRNEAALQAPVERLADLNRVLSAPPTDPGPADGEFDPAVDVVAGGDVQ